MFANIRLGTATAIFALSAATLVAPTDAQQIPRTSSIPLVEVTPYAGYLLAGNIADGPLGTSLSSGSGVLYGAQLAVPITRGVAIVGNFARASGDLKVGLPIVGGVSVGEANTWLYDGGLQLSAPAFARRGGAVIPFVQLGAGGARHDLNVSGLSSKTTNFVWNAGLGADLELVPGFGARVMVKDYIGRFDVEEATGLAIDGSTKNNWSFSLGLKLAF
jgi:hypothetical protein